MGYFEVVGNCIHHKISDLYMESVAIVFDKKIGPLAFGDSKDSFIKARYMEYLRMVSEHNKTMKESTAKHGELFGVPVETTLIDSNDYQYFDLAEIQAILSPEYVCKLLNYLWGVSANAEKQFKLLSMNAIELKESLDKIND